MAEQVKEIREKVRERYAAAARAVSEDSPAEQRGCCGSETVDGGSGSPDSGGCGCGSGSSARNVEGRSSTNVDAIFGAGLYGETERGELPDTARLASLGCGNPTAVAELEEGETVLDLGSGGGIDVLLSARRVGPSGRAYGLDMTDEMLELARANQRQAGVENAEFLKGTIEEVPLPDDSVDAVISNCVINLSADKPAVFAEAARVLRPGGRFAVTDIVAEPGMDEATRRDLEQWAGCIAGALTREEFVAQLEAAGFDRIELEETHRVHDHAVSAIVRAELPADGALST